MLEESDKRAVNNYYSLITLFSNIIVRQIISTVNTSHLTSIYNDLQLYVWCRKVAVAAYNFQVVFYIIGRTPTCCSQNTTY